MSDRNQENLPLPRRVSHWTRCRRRVKKDFFGTSTWGGLRAEFQEEGADKIEGLIKG